MGKIKQGPMTVGTGMPQPSQEQTPSPPTSCFFCSSEVGRPSAFCRWSYIIFSTVARISGSAGETKMRH